MYFTGHWVKYSSFIYLNSNSFIYIFHFVDPCASSFKLSPSRHELFIFLFLSYCLFLALLCLFQNFLRLSASSNHFLINVLLLVSSRFFCISFCLLLVYSRLNQFLKLTSISKFSAFTTEDHRRNVGTRRKIQGFHCWVCYAVVLQIFYVC